MTLSILGEFNKKKYKIRSNFYGLQENRNDRNFYGTKVLGLREEFDGLKAFSVQSSEEDFGTKEFSSRVLGLYAVRLENSNGREEIVFAYLDDKKLYAYSQGFAQIIAEKNCESLPKSVTFKMDRKNYVVFFFTEGKCYLFDGSKKIFSEVNGMPKGKFYTAHHDRLFMIDKSNTDLICFSKALEPTDFPESMSDGGSFEVPSLKGETIGLLSFMDKLWMVRRKGLIAITAFGDNREISVKELELPIGNIYDNGFLACGKYMVLFTDKGIFRFDGTKCELIGEAFADVLDFSRLKEPIEHCGECLVGMQTKSGESVVFVIDPFTSKGCLVPVRAELLLSTGNQLFATDENDGIVLFEERILERNECLEWELSNTDFNLGPGKKILRKLYLRGEGSYTVTVIGRGKRFSKRVENSACLPLDMPSNLFTINVKGKIKRLLDWEVQIDGY